MQRGKDYGTMQELREMQKYGQGSLSLIGCENARTTPPYEIYYYEGDPIRVYDEPIVQCFSLSLRNNSDVPIQISGVETQVRDYWCMRPTRGFTVDYSDEGRFDILLERTGTIIHPLENTIAPYAMTSLTVSVASSVAHIKCYAIYEMSLCVHYSGDLRTEDSGPMVLAIYNHFRNYDVIPGYTAYDPGNPFDEKSKDDGLSNIEQDWHALCRFNNYPGKRNSEFLREYNWYYKHVSDGTI